MWTFVFALLFAAGQFGQSSTGELRVTVRDAGGLPVQCAVTLVSDANDISQQLETAADGVSVAKRLPFGQYRVAINQPGFAPYDALVEIDSVVPREYRITLTPAPVQAQVTVRAEGTLLDTHQTSAVNRVGAETMQERITDAARPVTRRCREQRTGMATRGERDPPPARLRIPSAVRRRRPPDYRQSLAGVRTGA
jgi:hypothetical protein